MGVVGGPHCAVMCGAACGAISRSSQSFSLLAYHLGRICGYALLGAIATFAIQAIAWLSDSSKVLQPLWSFFHAFIFAWGLMLLIMGKQPLWIDQTGRRIWRAVNKVTAVKHGDFLIGMLWALMPCGLLYAALVIAAFNAEPIGGALSMAAFAIGSSVSLFLAPWAWLKLKTNLVEPYGMRIAGMLLVGASGFALWMQITHQNKIWCVT